MEIEYLELELGTRNKTGLVVFVFCEYEYVVGGFFPMSVRTKIKTRNNYPTSPPTSSKQSMSGHKIM